MSRSSGNKTSDIEKIYIPASGARSSGAGGGLGGRHPRRLAPRPKCFLSFGLVSEPEAEDCASGRKEKRLFAFRIL
nr:MAG TPA: hypothetical protein [Inoviridae sp.]